MNTFSSVEREQLLALKGVGPTVITRLEQMGFYRLSDLRNVTAGEILTHGAALTGSSCWKNSPQARAAVQAVIDLANRY